MSAFIEHEKEGRTFLRTENLEWLAGIREFVPIYDFCLKYPRESDVEFEAFGDVEEDVKELGLKCRLYALYSDVSQEEGLARIQAYVKMHSLEYSYDLYDCEFFDVIKLYESRYPNVLPEYFRGEIERKAWWDAEEECFRYEYPSDVIFRYFGTLRPPEEWFELGLQYVKLGGSELDVLDIQDAALFPNHSACYALVKARQNDFPTDSRKAVERFLKKYEILFLMP